MLNADCSPITDELSVAKHMQKTQREVEKYVSCLSHDWVQLLFIYADSLQSSD